MGSVKIKLDKELYDRASAHAEVVGYGSVEEFVAHLIEKEIRSTLDPESEEKIKERLRGLGYIS